MKSILRKIQVKEESFDSDSNEYFLLIVMNRQNIKVWVNSDVYVRLNIEHLYGALYTITMRNMEIGHMEKRRFFFDDAVVEIPIYVDEGKDGDKVYNVDWVNTWVLTESDKMVMFTKENLN